ncbi:MAG: NADH:ubiquinone oxidoreductase [Rhodobacteraceae bacterium]|nr:MAG: NADH:ubiquinone oxidoreductase [Paracoccaceae bacterium]
MPQSEMKNAPPLYGWAIATGVGAVAFGVSLLLVGIEGNGSVFIGAVVALIVGTIFTVAERPAPPAKGPGEAPTVPASTNRAPAPAAAAAAAPAAATASEAKPTDAPAGEGGKPKPLDAPQGKADDLKQITGVGPVLEGKLNDLGIYHFWQIANWTDTEIAWVEEHLNFKGRIERDDWIAQAGKLSDSSASKPSV